MEKKYYQVMQQITAGFESGLTEKGAEFYCDLVKQLNKARSDFQEAILTVEQRIKDMK